MVPSSFRELMMETKLVYSDLHWAGVGNTSTGKHIRKLYLYCRPTLKCVSLVKKIDIWREPAVVPITYDGTINRTESFPINFY